MSLVSGWPARSNPAHPAAPPAIHVLVVVAALAGGARAEATEAEALEVELREVIDGDTLAVLHEGERRRVRLAGVDAPELSADFKKKGNNPLAFGLDFSARTRQAMRKKAYAAKRFLGDRLERGEKLRLEPTGEHGSRLVAHVFPSGGDDPLGLMLVRAGLARVYTARFDFPREASYLRAQTAAMAARRGVWQLLEGRKRPPRFLLGVHADAAGDERENLDDEYVVIGRVAPEPVDLSGHILVDAAGHDYVLPEGTDLEPGEAITVRTGDGTPEGDTLYQHQGMPIWNNDGDTVYLLDPDGSELVRLRYANEGR